MLSHHLVSPSITILQDFFFYSRPQHSQGDWETSIRWKRGEGREGGREGGRRERTIVQWTSRLTTLITPPPSQVKTKRPSSILPNIIGIIKLNTRHSFETFSSNFLPLIVLIELFYFLKSELLLLTADCSAAPVVELKITDGSSWWGLRSPQWLPVVFLFQLIFILYAEEASWLPIEFHVKSDCQ